MHITQDKNVKISIQKYKSSRIDFSGVVVSSEKNMVFNKIFIIIAVDVIIFYDLFEH